MSWEFLSGAAGFDWTGGLVLGGAAELVAGFAGVFEKTSGFGWALDSRPVPVGSPASTSGFFTAGALPGTVLLVTFAAGALVAPAIPVFGAVTAAFPAAAPGAD